MFLFLHFALIQAIHVCSDCKTWQDKATQSKTILIFKKVHLNTYLSLYGWCFRTSLSRNSSAVCKVGGTSWGAFHHYFFQIITWICSLTPEISSMLIPELLEFSHAPVVLIWFIGKVEGGFSVWISVACAKRISPCSKVFTRVLPLINLTNSLLSFL